MGLLWRNRLNFIENLVARYPGPLIDQSDDGGATLEQILGAYFFMKAEVPSINVIGDEMMRDRNAAHKRTRSFLREKMPVKALVEEQKETKIVIQKFSRASFTSVSCRFYRWTRG